MKEGVQVTFGRLQCVSGLSTPVTITDVPWSVVLAERLLGQIRRADCVKEVSCIRWFVWSFFSDLFAFSCILVCVCVCGGVFYFSLTLHIQPPIPLPHLLTPGGL